MNTYFEIAELSVRMNPIYAPLLPQSIAYKKHFEGEADCVLKVTEEDYQKYEAQFPGTERGLIEYMVTGNQFYSALISHNGLLLHASAVELDGKAYLFSAPSGTGKSTHTTFWLKEFGDRATILNDDKPALRIMEDEIFVYGTPWSGKSDLNLNKKVKLGGICFIERGLRNEIIRVDPSWSIRHFLEQTIRPKDKLRASLLLDCLDKLIQKAPVYSMKCTPDQEAARIAYEAMSKGEQS